MGISYYLKKVYNEMNLGPAAPQESPGMSSWQNPGTSDAGNKGVRTGGTFDTAYSGEAVKFPSTNNLTEEQVTDIFKKMVKDLLDNNKNISNEYKEKVKNVFKELIS